MNSQTTYLVVMLSLATTGIPAASSHACTMPLPEVPSIEYEIEVEYEHYSFSTNRVQYNVEIEAEVEAPTSLAQCQCALNLGSASSMAPSSFDVTKASVGIRMEDGNEDLDPFVGFERDSDVEDFVQTLPGYVDGSSVFGFSLDVLPFTPPTLGPEEAMVLKFQIEFDLDDYDQVNGTPIQFGAGSNEPGHPLNLFSGYSSTLQLPSLSLLPSADFDSDGDTDGKDFLIWQRNVDFDGDATHAQGDADYDMEVDDEDLEAWQYLYGTDGLNSAPSTTVPEPSSILLLTTAMMLRSRAPRRSRGRLNALFPCYGDTRLRPQTLHALP